MNEWFARFMNGNGTLFNSRWMAVASRPELRATSAFGLLMWAAGLLAVMLALMEPASSVGLNLLSGGLFWALHLIPATMTAWFISGWLFNQRAVRCVSPWVLLMIAGAVTGLLLAPLSVTLELLFGVLDASDPRSKPLSFTYTDWLHELKEELRSVPPTTAIVWPAMNAFVVWRIGGLRDAAPANWTNDIPLSDSLSVQQIEVLSAGSEMAEGAKPDQSLSRLALKQSKSQIGTSGFLDRLPTRLGRDIVYIEAQEHYLRVVTGRGEDLLLQGFSHAVAELQQRGFDGFQIHRSVWVVWKHVLEVETGAGATSLVLSTGDRLKVGRRRVKLVLAAWHQRLV
jgi:LytTr DNA-binding domain